MTRSEAASYCALSPEAFSAWVGSGKVPGPLPGTKRWDRTAIDRAIDRMSGLHAESGDLHADGNALDAWRSRGVRKA